MAKARKVHDPAAPYVASTKQAARTDAPTSRAKPETTPATRYADDATFRKAADKVFKTRAELFRKLAR